MMIAILVIYFGLMLFIGYLASRKVRDSRDYFLGGKGFGPWFTAFKFAATWESGVKLVGSPGMAWNAGWSSLAMGIGTPLCYFFSFRVFGQRLKLAFDHFNVLTLPQMLEKRYESRAIRIVAAVAILIGLGGSLVAQFKATGEIFSAILGLDYLHGLFIGAVIVGIYCVMGGYLASVWTDFIQGIIMVLGSIAIFTATAQAAFGGVSWDLLSQLNASLASIDPNLLDVTGGGKMSWSNLFIILAITMLVGIAMPQQSVAIFSMRDVRTARVAMIVCVVFSAILAWTLATTGMMSHMVLDPSEVKNPDMVIALLIPRVLSPLMGGIYLAAVLAAIMSTVSGSIVVAASSLTEDIFKLAIPHRYERHPMFYNRVGASVFVLLPLLFAVKPPTIIFWIGVFAFGFLVFTFLMPMIGVILIPHATRQAALAQMVSIMIIIPVWTIWLQKPTGIPALLVGLIGAPLIFFAVNAVFKRKELAPEIKELWDKFAQL